MRHFSLLLIALVLLFITPARAQNDRPLVFLAQGDLWAWSLTNPTVRQLTQQGTVSAPMLAPNDGRIAYRALAAVNADELANLQTEGFIADYDLPTDLYLLDPLTGETRIIAGQPVPPNLTMAGGGRVRSAPAWSPDGNAIAWVEFGFRQTDAQIIVQPLDETQPQVLVTGIVLNDARAPEVRWGRSGIALRLTLQADGAQRFELYAHDGAGLSVISYSPPVDEYVQLYDWVRAGESDLLGVLLSSGRWALFDAATGSEVLTADVPVLVNSQMPDAPALRFGVTPELGFFWEMVFAQPSAASVAFPGAPGSVALSPDGSAVAFTGYPEFGALAIWQNGIIESITVTGSQSSDFLFVSSVLWGNIAWGMLQN
ncbi:MAG: hypothetical protein SF123_26140 [Chloroflexota bacterium]|nr:hypothetical protein [Chloroflexota bacterium]